MTNLPISAELIAEANARAAEALEDDYASLGRKLERSGIAIDAIRDKVAGFSVAVPTWGAGRGGTRFAMVGDASFDVRAAHAAEVPCVIYRLGYHDMPVEALVTPWHQTRNSMAGVALGLPVAEILGTQPRELTLGVQ